MADILLGVMILGPAVLTFLLKSNAALSFLVLCAGFVLSTSVIGDLKNLLSQLNLSTASSTIGILLLAVPLVLTLLLTRASAGKGLKFWLQLAAALCAGGLLALSVGPVLGSSSQFDVTNSSFWSNLQKIQSEVIGIGALISLLLIWFGGLKHYSRHR
jgi:cytochrome bd-type quinol oxidase subunit 2